MKVSKLKRLLFVGAVLAFGASYGVDLIGSVTVEGGPQINRYRGWLQYKGNRVDLKTNLHLQDKTQYFVGIDIKKGASLILLPFIPNVKITYLKSETDGTGNVTIPITIGGITFNLDEKIYSKVKFDQYDVTLYYTPLDIGLAAISWGFGAKIIDFYESTKSLTTGKSQEKSATIPLPYLYLNAGISLPLIKVFAEGKGLKVNGHYFYDWAAKAALDFNFIPFVKLSIGGGYRYQRYRIDDISDISADVRLKGAFGEVALTIAF